MRGGGGKHEGTMRGHRVGGGAGAAAVGVVVVLRLPEGLLGVLQLHREPSELVHRILRRWGKGKKAGGERVEGAVVERGWRVGSTTTVWPKTRGGNKVATSKQQVPGRGPWQAGHMEE